MKVKINIDLNSKMPLYKQLVNVVQDQINTGEYKKGDLLPSMNELSNKLNISKETVKKAYSVLRASEIIEADQGKGFYISGKNGDKIRTFLLLNIFTL